MFALAVASLVASVPCSGSGPGCLVTTKVASGNLALLVDTGADLTVLTEAAARRAGIRLPSDAPYIVTRGVGGTSMARLVRADVTVGNYTEKDVLVAVMADLKLGRGVQGLLGMTYLERFQASVGGRLQLEPIDARDREKKGGRGRSWWSLRFRTSKRRLASYRSALTYAKKTDAEVERSYGRSASGENLTSMIKALEAFAKKGVDKLKNEAARHGVPLEWRR